MAALAHLAGRASDGGATAAAVDFLEGLRRERFGEAPWDPPEGRTRPIDGDRPEPRDRPTWAAEG